MSETLANPTATTGTPFDSQNSLRARIDEIETCTDEQNFFVSAMKHNISTTYSYTDATLDAIIELFAPAVLCDFSCLKLQLLYVTLRDVLQLGRIQVDGRRRVYIPKAIVNVEDQSDSMCDPASTIIDDFKQYAERPSGSYLKLIQRRTKTSTRLQTCLAPRRQHKQKILRPRSLQQYFSRVADPQRGSRSLNDIL